MHRFFSVLGAVWVVIVDRYVKRLVASELALGESAELLPGFIGLRRVHNYGAAWSSLSGARWLLIIVTAVGLCVMAWLYFKIVRHPLGVWSLALVIGGGVGNLIDRVELGYVIDMLETQFISFPVFNVADIFVTCGAAAAAVYYLKYYEKYDAENWKKESHDGTDPSDGGKRKE
ncbi:MAG: signal peptidase II [Ruminococcaceae bacterium]|nr:signal peptidase II [Oscillospiraceae bacterium]